MKMVVTLSKLRLGIQVKTQMIQAEEVVHTWLTEEKKNGLGGTGVEHCLQQKNKTVFSDLVHVHSCWQCHHCSYLLIVCWYTDRVSLLGTNILVPNQHFICRNAKAIACECEQEQFSTGWKISRVPSESIFSQVLLLWCSEAVEAVFQLQHICFRSCKQAHTYRRRHKRCLQFHKLMLSPSSLEGEIFLSLKSSNG